MPSKTTLLALFVVSAGVSAAYAASNYDPEFDEKPWVEQQTQLPAFPKPANLVPIKMDTLANFDVAIDAASLDIGSDGVIRYTLVTRSRQGAENIYFEGIRCSTRERKRYAIGRSDKTWAQVTTAAWAPYNSVGVNYQGELAREYICPSDYSIQDGSEILKNIRSGGLTKLRQNDRAQ